MREWKFDNGIVVYESKYNYDLHCFEVYNGATYLGTVYPADMEDMKCCLEELDEGNDPISGRWEDGFGNICTLDGWGSSVPQKLAGRN